LVSIHVLIIAEKLEKTKPLAGLLVKQLSFMPLKQQW
jgi:hypothetical protein